MRTSVRLPLLLLLSGFCVSTHAQVYKCRQAMGAILYTDSPCGTDYATVAIMPKGALQFEQVQPSEAAIKAELERLSDQEGELAAELEAISARPGDNSAEAASLKMEIQTLLESVRRQKAALLGRGLAPEKGEELVVESVK